jgi:hypothetical protein
VGFLMLSAYLPRFASDIFVPQKESSSPRKVGLFIGRKDLFIRRKALLILK